MIIFAVGEKRVSPLNLDRIPENGLTLSSTADEGGQLDFFIKPMLLKYQAISRKPSLNPPEL
jgi:hypothetical protein